MSKCKIVQRYLWYQDGKPAIPDQTIKKFSSYWKAFLYKFLFYDVGANHVWKYSFCWEIEEDE